ncbi:MAG: hypothetical protein OXE94_02820 [Aestuariivita sp.]|nr:hypothetical protein [Aestuariivita sp.]MCY4203653.1 hypothetical protein [Aestuariivita sp.]MCY4287129.1 hypothetical protein [Aestuariivita sp.]MCY4345444.1 hypothetical protein [Aestuariivita sp.]
MATDTNRRGSQKVRRFQNRLHENAKPETNYRFYTLSDKVSSCEFLSEAVSRVEDNSGAAGVDGETFDDIAAYGAERWLAELSQELQEQTYRPKPVRQVLIAKKQPGQFRPLGIPCIRD